MNLTKLLFSSVLFYNCFAVRESLTGLMVNLSSKIELRCQGEPESMDVICACHGEDLPVLQTHSKRLCRIMFDAAVNLGLNAIKQRYPNFNKIYFESTKKFKIRYTGDSKTNSITRSPSSTDSGSSSVKIISGIDLCTSSCAKLDPYIESGMANIEGVQCRFDSGSVSCSCKATTGKTNETTLSNLIKKGVSTNGNANNNGIANLHTFGIHHCSSMLDVNLDFNKVIAAYPGLKKIYFDDMPSIKAIFAGSIQHGDVDVEFRNIRKSTGEDRSGYAILSGGVDYCINPCSKAPPTSDAVPPWKRPKCSECNPDSHLNLQFDNVDHILLDGLALANYGDGEAYGGSTFRASNVKTLRAETAYLTNVQDLGTYADLCWRVGSTGRRGAVEDREVSCSYLFPSTDSWPWWYYVLGVVLILVVGPCVCACLYAFCVGLLGVCGCTNDADETDGQGDGPEHRNKTGSSTEMEPMSPNAPAETEPPPYSVAVK